MEPWEEQELILFFFLIYSYEIKHRTLMKREQLIERWRE